MNTPARIGAIQSSHQPGAFDPNSILRMFVDHGYFSVMKLNLMRATDLHVLCDAVDHARYALSPSFGQHFQELVSYSMLNGVYAGFYWNNFVIYSCNVGVSVIRDASFISNISLDEFEFLSITRQNRHLMGMDILDSYVGDRSLFSALYNITHPDRPFSIKKCFVR